MKYKDSIKWLESLKQQIGQAQHSDLWHFEQAIDETIDNLRPLAESHGRLIDADELIERIERFRDIHNYYPADIDATMRWFINQICGAKTIIEAENSSAIDDDVKKYCDYLKSETYDFCNRIENGEVSDKWEK